jgi:hypothetical protein
VVVRLVCAADPIECALTGVAATVDVDSDCAATAGVVAAEDAATAAAIGSAGAAKLAAGGCTLAEGPNPAAEAELPL